LIKEFEHWLVLLRPAQPTLGSLVLAAKGEATAYSRLTREAFVEQADVVSAIERGIDKFCAYERINYLMLMMVDPNVHFHVVPRYSQPREWHGIQFPDAGWPGPPLLGSAIQLSPQHVENLVRELKSNFC
jgi:diadenosine tetraphosphate (Ap4A) HIT family hydrolase